MSEAPQIEQAETEYDYERYLRFRSLNAMLSAIVPWVGVWLMIGVVVAALGYATRPVATLVGLDPAGRAHSVETLNQAVTDER